MIRKLQRTLMFILLTLIHALPLRAQDAASSSVYLPLIANTQPAASGIDNGDFETGNSVWSAKSNHGRTVIRKTFGEGVSTHSGQYAAWLGFYALEVSTIEQQVTVPADKPFLTYWHWVVSADQCLRDKASVLINDSEVESTLLCADSQTNGWVKRTVNLSAYAGQSIRLTFHLKNDGNRNSNLYIDDVGFSSAG